MPIAMVAVCVVIMFLGVGTMSHHKAHSEMAPNASGMSETNSAENTAP